MSWGLVPEGCNPCQLAVKYPARKRERFLTDGEFTRLGTVLDEVEARGGASAPAVAAIRLLMLTGCRKSEILTLRWEDVALDEKELRLPDAKTGARVVPLSPLVVKLLSGLPRDRGNPWVIPGRKPGTHMRNINQAWKVIRARAGLEGVRIHDLRHSFASRALALGESLPMIGKLLGHSQIETTARYAHLARDSVQEATERISASIAADILGEGWRHASGQNPAHVLNRIPCGLDRHQVSPRVRKKESVSGLATPPTVCDFPASGRCAGSRRNGKRATGRHSD